MGKRTQERMAAASARRCRLLFQETSLAVGQDRQLPAVSWVVRRVLLAGNHASRDSRRMLNLDLCREWPAAATAGNQQYAMRAVHARATVRDRQSKRREQQPKEDGQFAQAGLPEGFSLE